MGIGSFLYRVCETNISNFPAGKYIDFAEGENIDNFVKEKVEIEIKYAGYIKRQEQQINQIKKLENTVIPEDIDFADFKGLRLEAREKLNKVRPVNVGQASRIPGVSPSDISALLLELKARGI